MAALAFTTTAKNAFLECLIKAGSVNAYLDTLRLFNAGATQLASQAVTWGTPVQGVASLVTALATPTVTGAAATMDWYSTASGVSVATGTPSLTGGGGNAILGTLSLVASTPVAIAAQLRVPLSSAGTLKINQLLASMIATRLTTGGAAIGMANTGIITFYDGTQPATADTAITTQNVLGSLTLATADYSTATGGQSVLAASKTVTPSASGTVSWFRWQKGTFIIDGSVGTVGTDILVDTTTWVVSVNRSMTGATLVWP